MENMLTKTQAEELKKNSADKTMHNLGEIYPEIFDKYENLDFKEGMPMDAAIMWLGRYEIDSTLFPKRKCPVCGKEEVLIPYACIASGLTGCHRIHFYCTNCHEQIAYNNINDYYDIINYYIEENRNSLKSLKTETGFPVAPPNTIFIHHS